MGIFSSGWSVWKQVWLCLILVVIAASCRLYSYTYRMAGFEIDCNDGKGEPSACHHVGEFYSVIKVVEILELYNS